jgi:hypothetical protein
MKYLRVLILRPDGKTQWIDTGWGKGYLDYIRTKGVILFSEVHYYDGA